MEVAIMEFALHKLNAAAHPALRNRPLFPSL
jgi:hypothetical protein